MQVPSFFVDGLNAPPAGHSLPYLRTDVRTIGVTSIRVVRQRESLPAVPARHNRQRQRTGSSPYRYLHIYACRYLLVLNDPSIPASLSSRLKRVSDRINPSPTLALSLLAASEQRQFNAPCQSSSLRDNKESNSNDNGEEERDGEGYEDTFDNSDAKIPKPSGEVGRPGRGGYNLQAQLNWSASDFDRVKVRCTSCYLLQHFIIT